MLGKVIKHQRDALGMKQDALARRTGLRQSVISEIEGGKRNPKLPTLRKLTDALGTPVEELIRAAHGAHERPPLPGRDVLPPAFAQAVQRVGQNLTPGQWETAAAFLEWLAAQGPQPPAAYGYQAPERRDNEDKEQGQKTA